MVLWLSRGGYRGLPTLLANLRVVAYCLKYAWLALLRSNVRGFVSEGIVRQLSLPRREAPALVSGPQRLYRVGLRLRVCQTGLERGPLRIATSLHETQWAARAEGELGIIALPGGKDGIGSELARKGDSLLLVQTPGETSLVRKSCFARAWPLSSARSSASSFSQAVTVKARSPAAPASSTRKQCSSRSEFRKIKYFHAHFDPTRSRKRENVATLLGPSGTTTVVRWELIAALIADAANRFINDVWSTRSKNASHSRGDFSRLQQSADHYADCHCLQ
jgi:hypothetical protein